MAEVTKHAVRRDWLAAFGAALLIVLGQAPLAAAPTQPISAEVESPEDQAEVLSQEAADAIEQVGDTAFASDDAPPPVLIDPEIDELELEHRLVPLTREELGALSEQWLTIVRQKTDEVMAAEVAIDRSQGDVADEVRAHLAEQIFQRNEIFDRFSLVLASWERKLGGNEEDAQKIAELRAYRDAVVLDELRTSGMETLFVEGTRWLTDPKGGVELALQIVIVVLAIGAVFALANLLKRAVNKALDRFENFSNLLQRSIASAVFWLVLAAGAIVAFSLLGMDVTPLFALIGAASFILAFAFQETLGNLASGFMIIVHRPFDEGDTVEIGGVTGVIKSVSLVATKIRTFDNQIVLVPNRNVWGNLIKNLTASATRRVDLVFGIGYGDSIEEATKVLNEVVAAHEAVLSDPEPTIKVHELADSSVNFICRPWVKTDDYWAVYWDLTQQVKLAFDERGISIPFPQRDVHLHQVSNAG